MYIQSTGQPWLQVRKTSAGLERESNIRLGISLEGTRAADWAALKMTSWMALCRVILSPLESPTTPTVDLVVSKRVSCVMAFRAGVGGAVKRHSQPVTK